jgi:DNA gyrase subunit A
VRDGSAGLLTVTEGGFAKRTRLDEWTPKGRGGLGVIAMRVVEDRGSLVGAVVVNEGDEVMAITAAGGVIRTPIVAESLRFTSRDTMGVRLMNLGEGDTVVAVATNAERAEADDEGAADVPDQATGQEAGAADDAAPTGPDGSGAPS